MTLYCDNEAACQLMLHPGKHIEIRYLNIRERIKRRGIEVCRVASEDNVADVQTKPLDQILFAKFKLRLGVRDVREVAKHL